MTTWLRDRTVTSGWVTLFFLAVIFAPGLLTQQAQQGYRPWAWVVIASLAGLLYWFKHPDMRERALLIAALLWFGVHMSDVVPGLRAYEASQEQRGAYSDDLCHETETRFGTSENCPTRPSFWLGVPIVLYAVYLAAIAPTRAKEPKQKAVDELMLMRYGLFDLREAELQLLVVGERLLRSMRDSGWIVAGRLYDDSGRSGETWETKTAEAQRWLDYLQGGGYVERQEPPATPSQGQTFQSAQSWRLKTDVNRQLLAEAIEKWRGVRRKA